jgi:uncharacterized membrane protein
MGVLYFIVPMGIVASLIAFLIFEGRALRAKRGLMALGENANDTIADKLEQYNTYNNTLYFTGVIFAYTFIISQMFYDPSYGLIHALMYIFITTFLSSGILFVLKWKKDLLVKVFAAFLYGAAHIAGASFAFLVSFILS